MDEGDIVGGRKEGREGRLMGEGRNAWGQGMREA